MEHVTTFKPGKISFDADGIPIACGLVWTVVTGGRAWEVWQYPVTPDVIRHSVLG